MLEMFDMQSNNGRNALRSLSTALPYVIYAIFLVVLHARMDLTTGDMQAFVSMLEEHSLLDVMSLRYWTWGSRLLIEAVLIYIVHAPLLWICLDIAAFLLILHYLGVLARRAGAHEHVRFFLLALLLCYPYPTLSEAGWIPTTVNYIWPLACCLFALSVFIEALDDTNASAVSVWRKVLAALAALFAANLEQLALVIWIFLAFILLRGFLREKLCSRYLLFVWGLISLECLVIVTCPGNMARTSEGADYWWPDPSHFLTPVTFDSLSAFDKFYLGFASAFDGYLYGYYSGPCFLAGLLTLILAARAFFEKESLWRKVVSTIALLVLLGVPLTRLCPPDYLPWFIQRITQYPLFGFSITRFGVSVLEAIACVGIALLLLGSRQRDEIPYGKYMAAVWIVCLLSRIALGFTVSLFGSGYRIMMPLDMACIWLASVYLSIYVRSRAYGWWIVMCVIVLVAVYSTTLTFSGVTLWA